MTTNERTNDLAIAVQSLTNEVTARLACLAASGSAADPHIGAELLMALKCFSKKLRKLANALPRQPGSDQTERLV